MFVVFDVDADDDDEDIIVFCEPPCASSKHHFPGISEIAPPPVTPGKRLSQTTL